MLNPANKKINLIVIAKIPNIYLSYVFIHLYKKP